MVQFANKICIGGLIIHNNAKFKINRYLIRFDIKRNIFVLIKPILGRWNSTKKR